MVDHKECIQKLEYAQDSFKEVRDRARENETAIYVRGGQWEPTVWARLANRPRYTIDLIYPILKQIVGEIKRASFDITILPASGDAAKETAATYEGIIRHIENISRAKHSYNAVAKDIVSCGIGGLRVSNRFANSVNFDQDLMIDYIPNFKDRVWFDPGSMQQTHDDAEYCYILYPLTHAQYDQRFKKGSGISVSENRSTSVVHNHKDTVVIGEYVYRKRKKKNLLLLSNGSIIEDTDQARTIIDELLSGGLTVISERETESETIYTRYFDGGDFLGDEVETPFEKIPIVPAYANFSVIENEINYFGVPEKLLDAQRVTNYTLSRLTEDTSLRPKSKLAMTPEQTAGHEASYKTMNIDNKPMLHYNHVDGQPPPMYLTPAPPDPTLVTILSATTDYINRVAGMFAANMGENPGLQSGVAIDKQIDRGNNGAYDYLESMEIALTQVAMVLLPAIPKIYGDRQRVRIVGEDGSADYATLREQIQDRQTGRMIEVNDLSKGFYDVVVSIGPGFQNKQQETVENIIEISKVDPSLLQLGSDVLLNNINAPGLKQIAERKRRQMVLAGVIPEDQLTKEEITLLQQQQAQGQNQTSPMDQLALATAQAELKKAEAQTADIISKVEDRQTKNELELKSLQLKAEEMAIKSQNDQQRMAIDIQESMDRHFKAIADTLSALRAAMGADGVMSPVVAQGYNQQAEKLITGT